MNSNFETDDVPTATSFGKPTCEALREQAARCRRLTSSVLDRRTYDALTSMAAEYEAEAERLGRTG